MKTFKEFAEHYDGTWDDKGFSFRDKEGFHFVVETDALGLLKLKLLFHNTMIHQKLPSKETLQEAILRLFDAVMTFKDAYMKAFVGSLDELTLETAKVGQKLINCEDPTSLWVIDKVSNHNTLKVTKVGDFGVTAVHFLTFNEWRMYNG